MKKYLIISTFTLLALTSTVKADTTWGVGVGPMYNGLGLNIGKTTESTFAYSALGCQSVTTGTSSDSNTNENDGESNCGVGFGYISQSIFKSNRHGLGLNLGVSYNTAEQQTEWRLRPGYHFFVNGIDKRGLNLGAGTVFYYDTEKSNDINDNTDVISLFLNIGYQF